jgi:hypothetical protein
MKGGEDNKEAQKKETPAPAMDSLVFSDHRRLASCQWSEPT